MEIIKLYTPDGVEIPLFSYAENRVITDAKCTRVFQGEESITIQIESAKHLSIPLYSYVDFRGVRYRMNRISEVENVWNDVLEYRIELESVRYELGRVLFDTSIDPSQAALEKVYSGGSFGNLYHFADLLASNLKRALGATWRIEGVNQNDKGGQLLSFERSENCLSALHKIAQAFHVVFSTSEDVMTGVRTLRFVSEYEYDPSPSAEWHVGNEIFSCNRKNVVTDNIVTRLWCFGSEEGAEKAGDRLTLPAKNTTNSYIEDPEKVRLYGLSEGLYIDEEAKPTYTGSVSKITSDPLTFHSPAWSLFSKLQDGETARIHFETGNLQGMEFSVKRVSDGKITINPIVDNDLKIQYPSKDVGSAYSIAVGDTFKCLGVNYPLNLVLDAQDRLQASATLRYNEVSVSRLEYDLVMREGLDFDIAVGDVVTIVGDCIPSGRANLMIQQTEINLLSGEFAVLVSKFARKRRIQEVYDSWKDRLRKILGDRMASDTHREFILDVDKRIELLVQEDENISRIVELKEDREVALSRYKGLTEEIGKRVTTAEFTEKVETLVSKQALANDLKGYVVNREFENLKTIVNNEISAWTVEGVPHSINHDINSSTINGLNTEPYNSWGKVGTDRKLEAHVGDTWLVNNAGATENGKMYRFVKGSANGTYRWVQLSDSPSVVALNEAKRLSEVVDDTKVEFLARLGDKVSAEFTARKAELKGDKGDPADPIRPNLLKGFIGEEKSTSSAAGSANVHTRFGVKPFLEQGKRYVLSADFELTEGTANAVSIGLLTTSGTFLSEAKNPLNGTKTRVSLQISLDASANLEEIVDVLGYAGERGKTRGNIAKYYNIKLEEVTNDSDKASAYLPHPDDLKGADGKSITLDDLKIKWEGDRLNIAGYKSDSLTGSAGKDAVPVRPNLFDFSCLDKNSKEKGLRIDEVTAGRILSAGTTEIHGGRDLTRIVQGVAAQFDLVIHRTAKQDGVFSRRLTLRTMRPNYNIYYNQSPIFPEAAGTYHIEVICPITKSQSQDPQELYVHGWLLDYGKGLLDCELKNIKIEYIYEDEPYKPSIYTPKGSDMIALPPKIVDGMWHIADSTTRQYLNSGIKALGVDGKSVTVSEVTTSLKQDTSFLASVKGDRGERGLQGIKGQDGKSVTAQEVASEINTTEWQAQLADQAASKVTASDAHLAKIREGMATRKELEGYGQELNAVIDRQTEILGMHETLAQWVDVHKMAINSINRDMEQAVRDISNHTITIKKHDDTLITLVEQDIIRFGYYAAASQDWADYTDREYVGGGHHPDPWGGGVGDGYMRTVHNYEIWRSLDRIPSVYIEQSRKTLRTDEYEINGQPHRDLSALIVYSLQDVAPIERGTARHWQLFTSPFVSTILRYGNKTVMGTEGVSGNKVGDYYNLPLDKSCTYDIYCNNDGSSKYKIYIVKNGEYK